MQNVLVIHMWEMAVALSLDWSPTLRFMCQEGPRPLLCHVRSAIGPAKWEKLAPAPTGCGPSHGEGHSYRPCSSFVISRTWDRIQLLARLSRLVETVPRRIGGHQSVVHRLPTPIPGRLEDPEPVPHDWGSNWWG